MELRKDELDDHDNVDPNIFIIKGALLTYNGKYVVIKVVNKAAKNMLYCIAIIIGRNV